MSRWKAEFDQHPFQEIWADLKNILTNVNVDDQTISTSVEELARLRKVVGYIDSILLCLDVDLTPQSIWASFQTQATNCRTEVNNYLSNRNIAHIVQANQHADNLLSYVKPFLVLPEDAARSATRAVEEYSKSVGIFLSGFESQCRNIVTALDEIKNKSDGYLKKIEEDKEKISDVVLELLGPDEKSESARKAILDLLNAAQEQAAAIHTFHVSLLTGDDLSDSIQEEISTALIETKSASADSASLLSKTAILTKELQAFHEKIFGTPDADSGKRVGGLNGELNLRMATLERVEIAQSQKHQALAEKIEALLPGATSAGLASAYGKLAKQFEKSVELYTRLFGFCVFVLAAGAVMAATESITLFPAFSVTWAKAGDYDFVFKALLFKAPLVAPIVWMALFATKRRSQYERLKQEYSHKEAFATSYESYKLQLQELKIESDVLQKELISKAIEAIAFNASSTLDGKHDEKLPAYQILEKILDKSQMKIEDLMKFVEGKR